MDHRRRWASWFWLAWLVLFTACSTGPAAQPVAPSPIEEPETVEAEPTAAPATEVITDSAALALETDHGLLINLTTDDTWSANMALNLATTARNQGLDPVVVFLNVRGVYLADRERMPATEGNSDLTIHEKIQALVDAGGQVIACPSCSEEAGLTQADYLDGVVIGEPGEIVPLLANSAITVISYPGPNRTE
ncbi:MAG: DsrE family protein [Chloroflexaceae bacterium]|nr:DsrE family protein [Chloroflexaceae bacterium]